jgi:hypothetical protein
MLITWNLPILCWNFGTNFDKLLYTHTHTHIKFTLFSIQHEIVVFSMGSIWHWMDVWLLLILQILLFVLEILKLIILFIQQSVQILVGHGGPAGPRRWGCHALGARASAGLRAGAATRAPGICRPTLLGLQNHVLDVDPHAWVSSDLSLGSADPPRTFRPVRLGLLRREMKKIYNNNYYYYYCYFIVNNFLKLFL